jgi:SAM-dependent methyltransferase
MTYREWLYGSYRSGFKGPSVSVDQRRLDELYRVFLARRPARVLELGAGAGDVVEWLRARGVKEAWGVDGSAEQVAEARTRGREVREGDLLEVLGACADASLDGLIALDVLEHLTRDQLVRLAMECARVLAPGGSLLVQTPNGQAWRVAPVWLGDLTHETLLCEATLSQLFAPAGMNVERAWGVTPGFGNPVRVLRTLLWHIMVIGPKFIDWLEAGRPLRTYERVFCALLRKSS